MQDSSKKGSVVGAVLLVAGCCIGTGMLGLPVVSAAAGFGPSAFMLVLCWLFMLATGLLLLEVNLYFKGEVSLLTLAERTLGWSGKAICWCTYLFLFYTLMVAFVTASGLLASDFLESLTGQTLHHGVGGLFFCVLFGWLIYTGIGAVEGFNRLLMGGLILSYLALACAGFPYVNHRFLEHQNWSAAPTVLPLLVVSFGYHNLVPTLTAYLHRDRKRLILTLMIGSAIPCLIYLLWEWLILGIVPFGGFQEALSHGEMATESLKNAVGSPWIVGMAQCFAFFAITTSFLSVALSFVDFLADGLKIPKTTKGKSILILFVLLPPLLCAMANPDLFLAALGYAGGYGAVLLFGLLPVGMVWKQRYHTASTMHRILPGGRAPLFLIAGFAFWVIYLQLTGR